MARGTICLLEKCYCENMKCSIRNKFVILRGLELFALIFDCPYFSTTLHLMLCYLSIPECCQDFLTFLETQLFIYFNSQEIIMVCQTIVGFACFSAVALNPQSYFSVKGKADLPKGVSRCTRESQMTKLCSRVDTMDSMHFFSLIFKCKKCKELISLKTLRRK